MGYTIFHDEYENISILFWHIFENAFMTYVFHSYVFIDWNRHSIARNLINLLLMKICIYSPVTYIGRQHSFVTQLSRIGPFFMSDSLSMLSDVTSFLAGLVIHLSLREKLVEH